MYLELINLVKREILEAIHLNHLIVARHGKYFVIIVEILRCRTYTILDALMTNSCKGHQHSLVYHSLLNLFLYIQHMDAEPQLGYALHMTKETNILYLRMSNDKMYNSSFAKNLQGMIV